MQNWSPKWSVITFYSQLVLPRRVLEWLMSSEALTFPLRRQHLHSRGFHSPKPCPHPEKSREWGSSLQCFFLFWVYEIHINSLNGIPLCEALCWECKIPLKHILKNILVNVWEKRAETGAVAGHWAWVRAPPAREQLKYLKAKWMSADTLDFVISNDVSDLKGSFLMHES